MVGKAFLLVLVLGTALAAITWLYLDTVRRDAAETPYWARTARATDVELKDTQENVCARQSGAAVAACNYQAQDLAYQKRAAGGTLLVQKRAAVWTRAFGFAGLALVPLLLVLVFQSWLLPSRGSRGAIEEDDETGASGAAVYLCILVVAAAVVATGWFGYLSFTQERADFAGRIAQERATDAVARKHVSDVCSLLAIADAENCRKDVALRTERRKSEEGRLFAQRQFAVWMQAAALAAMALVLVAVAAIMFRFLASSRRQGAAPVLPLALASALPAQDAAPVALSSASGQLQVRAYVQVIHAVAEFYGEWINVSLRLRNSGQSPALQVVITATVQALESAALKPDALRLSDPSVSMPVDIASRETREATFVFHVSQLSPDVYAALSDRSAAFELAGRITWNDVFGEREPLSFMMREGEAQHYAMSQAIRREAQILLVPYFDS
ncbi:MAG: hypothetical protein LCH46_07665 [Proteobacteria bacterium]|nr:hypothetical protein [Pseudomonadota bacterium]